MKRAIDEFALKRLSSAVIEDLSERRISEAIDKLSFLIQNVQDDRIRADFEELRANYYAMLSFLIQGGTDEHRAEIQEQMAQRVWMLLQGISRDIRLHISDDAYCKTYSQLTEQGIDAETLMHQWSITPPSEERFILQDHLFHLLWISPLWKSADRSLWQDFISRQNTLVQQHLIWGIFLSCYEYHDQEKFSLINSLADNEDNKVLMAAVTAMSFLLRKYKDILTPLGLLSAATIPNRFLPVLMESDQEYALILASKKDTEDEARELDAIPQDNINEALKKAFALKISYIKRRIAKGYDPNLNRMSILHSSKFFSTCSHWFLPFDSSHPMVQSLGLEKDGQEHDILSKFSEISNDCDVDKYAMLEMMNDNQTLAQTLAAQMEQSGMGLEEVKLPDQTLRHMMQNLYRFFTQSSASNSLNNPFEDPTMLIADDLFRPQNNEQFCLECVRTLLEANQVQCAASVLEGMVRHYGTSAELFHLKGCCFEKNDNYLDAYRCYTQAAFLEEPDRTIAGKLYHCSRILLKKTEEHRWLDVLIQMEPENTEWLYRKAELLLKEKKWNEAREIFYRITYYQPSDMDVVRGIVTSELMLQNIPTAVKYSEKLLDDHSPYPWESRTLLGNLAFIQGDWKRAKVYYTSAAESYIKDTNSTYAKYLEHYESCREALEANNISKIDIDLMRDILWTAFIHGL